MYNQAGRVRLSEWRLVQARKTAMSQGSNVGWNLSIFVLAFATVCFSHLEARVLNTNCFPQVALLREDSRSAADRLEESEAVQRVHAGKVIDLKKEVGTAVYSTRARRSVPFLRFRGACDLLVHCWFRASVTEAAEGVSMSMLCICFVLFFVHCRPLSLAMRVPLADHTAPLFLSLPFDGCFAAGRSFSARVKNASLKTNTNFRWSVCKAP